MSKAQNFSNHSRIHAAYHLFTTPLCLTFLVWSVVRLVRTPGADTAYALVGSLALAGVVVVARSSPLRAQDRLIRLEEQLRYQRLLPAETAARAIAILEPRHYIALRFAADSELPELVDQVLRNPALTSKQIKQEIRNWKPDTFRV